MISIGFTKRDLVRSAWAALFAALSYIVLVQPTDVASWKTAAIGAGAAALAAVKNLILGDSTLKG